MGSCKSLVGRSLPYFPQNYASVLGQFRSFKRLSNDDDLKKMYHDTIKTDVESGFIEKMSQNDISNTENARIWYLPHHPVFHPQKPEKFRRVCNAALKYQGISFNDKLLPIQFSGNSKCNDS